MALTVVMIYKTTGHLNFAQGEMAMFTTFVVFVLAVEQGLNVWLAIGLVVIVAMIVGAAVERILIQPLESRSVLAPVILTFGLFFILNGGAAAIWGTQPKTPIPAPFPGGLDDKIDIITDRSPNFFITYKALGVWITVAVLVIVLNLLLKRTKLGLAYRAVAANAESSLIVGIPVKRMLMLGWALAAGIGAIAGAIIAQYRNLLDFNFMAAVLLFGFAAACVGGFDSIKGAVVGGLLVGIVETFAPALFTFVGSELSFVMVLIVILIVLYFRPQGLFGSKRWNGYEVASRSSSNAGRLAHRGAAAARLAGRRRLLPVRRRCGRRTSAPCAGRWRLTLAIAIQGLNIVTGYSGQISVGHSAFFGIGAYTTMILVADHGWPFLATLPVAGASASSSASCSASRRCKSAACTSSLITLGLALAFPAIVKSDNFFGIDFASSPAAATAWSITSGDVTSTRVSAGTRRRGLRTGGSANDWVFTTVFVVVLIIFALTSQPRYAAASGAGLIAMRDNETGAAVSGVYPAQYKVLAFATSAFVTAVGGGCFSLAVTTIGPDTFGLQRSIEFIAGLVIGGVATIIGPAIGGFLVDWLPHLSFGASSSSATDHWSIPSADARRAGGDDPLRRHPRADHLLHAWRHRVGACACCARSSC